MSTLSLIVGSYLMLMFTVVKVIVLLKRYPSFKERFVGLVTFPKSMERRDEWLIVIAQIMALLWIMLGAIIKVSSLEPFLIGLPFNGLIQFTLLSLPVFIFILVLRLASRK
jgi:hypothetical protein